MDMTQLATSSDHLLKNAIEKQLEWAPDVTADHIGVGVTDGTVTLSGQVTRYPEKKAAVAATLRVRGVTAVADEILVQHHFGHLEDSDIAREATTILRASVVVPDIFLISYVVERGGIVFRTGAGTKLAAVRSHSVALEVDGEESTRLRIAAAGGTLAGDTWGLGTWWGNLEFVKKHRSLR
jgi:BON domain